MAVTDRRPESEISQMLAMEGEGLVEEKFDEFPFDSRIAATAAVLQVEDKFEEDLEVVIERVDRPYGRFVVVKSTGRATELLRQTGFLAIGDQHSKVLQT